MKINNLPFALINWDNEHYTFNKIDSYDRVMNMIISFRGSGKSTSANVLKLYAGYLSGTPWIVFRRLKVHLNEEYINSIQGTINKFLKEPIEFTYKKGDIKSGEVDVYVGEKLFCRFIALSCELSMIKSYFVKNCGGILFDEFICDMRMGEKYLKNEYFKFQEIYTTYCREAKRKLKCYLVGNPYSLYNPYFLNLGISPAKLKCGEIYAPKNKMYVVEWYEGKESLKKKIEEKNPFLTQDESYREYALNGVNVDDKDIKLVPIHPRAFKLKQVYFVENQNIGIYENTTGKGDLYYWAELIDVDKITRDVYCLSINDLSSNRIALSISDLRDNRSLATAMRLRHFGFKNIEAYYLFLEIYKLL